MPIIQKGDKYYQCRYKVDELKLLIGARIIDIKPFQVNGISFENNFETDIFPIFKLSLVINPKLYYDILKNKNAIKFKIRIQKYYRDLATETNTLDIDYINDTFVVFLDDAESQFNEELYNNRRETEGFKKDEISLFETDTPVDFFLFKECYANNLRKTVNNIFSGCNLTTVIAWLFYTSGMKNLLLSPLENRKTIGTVIVPPMHVFNALRFLDVQYGFYKQGSMIYFDVYRAYILNYCGGCTAWEPHEWRNSTIYVLDRNNKDNRTACWIRRNDDCNHFTIVQDEHVRVTNSSIVDNVIEGSTPNVIDAGNDSKYTTSNPLSVSQNGGHSNTFHNDTSNSFIGSTYAAQKAAIGTVITVAMNDFNIDAILPNKNFSFIFEDSKSNQKYKGQYRISSSFIQLIKDGDDYSISASAVFKKIRNI